MINFKTRKATINDAEHLTKFIIQLDNESDYLLFGPGERNIDIEVTKSYLKKINDNERSSVLIAENDNLEIIGFICGETLNLKRAVHVMKANIGVLKDARGTKVARELAIKFIKTAKNSGILRIEVTVIKENKLSLNLCKKFGFEIEGLKKSSIKIGDKYHDEYLLAKLL